MRKGCKIEGKDLGYSSKEQCGSVKSFSLLLCPYSRSPWKPGDQKEHHTSLKTMTL